jgi:hypothetical protein
VVYKFHLRTTWKRGTQERVNLCAGAAKFGLVRFFPRHNDTLILTRKPKHRIYATAIIIQRLRHNTYCTKMPEKRAFDLAKCARPNILALPPYKNMRE